MKKGVFFMYIQPETLEKTYKLQQDFVSDCNRALYAALELPIHCFKGSLFAESGIDTPLCNAVVGCKIGEGMADEVVTHIIERFSERKLAHSWWIEGRDESPELLASLERHKLHSIGEFLGMRIDLNFMEVKQAVTSEVTIEVVDDFLAWSAVIAAAFEMPPAVAVAYSNLFSTIGFDGPFIHLSAKKNGKIISTGTLLITPQGGYIYNIATEEKERRQGHATAVMRKLLLCAKQKGCQQIALLASPPSVGLYEKLGFRKMSLFHIYL